LSWRFFRELFFSFLFADENILALMKLCVAPFSSVDSYRGTLLVVPHG